MVNDLHGKLTDGDNQIGVEELTTYLKNRKNIDDNVLILSSGDMWQGTAESNLTFGKMMTEWMNDVGFLSMTLGNHEYDWGEEYILQNLELADFPFLAINIYEKATNERASYCTPSVMVSYGGVQVGIIGAIGDCYSSIASDKVADVYFKVGSELTTLVKDEADKLRAQGADFIVYSLHDGYGSSSTSSSTYISDSNMSAYYQTALSNGYVDLVFEAHTHQYYVAEDSYGVYHLQAGGDNNKGISHVEISMNIVTGEWRVSSKEIVSYSTYSSLAEDPIVDTLKTKYADELAAAYEVLGGNDSYRNSDYICDLVAQLYFKAAKEEWKDEYDIILGGGFLKARAPYSFEAGNITYGDVYGVLPFDNTLVLCSVSGTNLKSKFINTTNSAYHIYYEDSTAIQNVSNTGTYYIIVDSYTATYAPNKLTIIDYYSNTNYFARDLVAAYIRAGGLTASTADDKPLSFGGTGGGSGTGSTGGSTGGTTGGTTGGNEGITENYTLTSIPDILSIGETLSAGAISTEYYYVKGTVTSILNSKYGNLYIEDENGNQLYIYGTYTTDGTRYDSMETPPAVGDELVLYGAIQHYVSGGSTIIEMVHATIVQ